MSETTKTRMGAALLAAGLVLLILGALRGEAAVVLRKATLICMECIGLG